MRGARDKRLLDILGCIVVIGYRDGKAEHLPFYRADAEYRPGDGKLDAIPICHRHGADRHVGQAAGLRLRVPEIGLHVLADTRPARRNPNLVIGSRQALGRAIGVRAGRQEQLDAVTLEQIRCGGILDVNVVDDFDGQVQELAVPADPVGSLQVAGAAPVGRPEDDVLDGVLGRRPLVPGAIESGRLREGRRVRAEAGDRRAGEGGQGSRAGGSCAGDCCIGGQLCVGWQRGIGRWKGSAGRCSSRWWGGGGQDDGCAEGGGGLLGGEGLGGGGVDQIWINRGLCATAGKIAGSQQQNEAG